MNGTMEKYGYKHLSSLCVVKGGCGIGGRLMKSFANTGDKTKDITLNDYSKEENDRKTSFYDKYKTKDYSSTERLSPDSIRNVENIKSN